MIRSLSKRPDGNAQKQQYDIEGYPADDAKHSQNNRAACRSPSPKRTAYPRTGDSPNGKRG